MSVNFVTIHRFNDVPSLHPKLQQSIATQFKYEYMSPVQADCIPAALSNRDVLAKAPTGSGKTLAFLVPTVHKLLTNTQQQQRGQSSIQAVVVSPTRELAQQIAEEGRKLMAGTHLTCEVVVGGTNIKSDIKHLSNGCSILVATPGRFLDLHQNMSTFANMLQHVQVLILDEADRMLDDGFKRELTRIVAALPKQRQTLLFSATISNEIRAIARELMSSNTLQVESKVPDQDKQEPIPQTYTVVPIEQQGAFLVSLLQACMQQHKDTYKIVVFFPTARATGYWAQLCNIIGLPVFELHSRKSQSARQKASDGFDAGKRAILFTSDVSARGMDYERVTHVIQMGIPSSAEQYTHRIGRTGRAGRSGEALLVVMPDELPFVRRLENISEINPASVPLVNIPQLNASQQKSLQPIAEQNYAAWLGYYNGHLKLLGWSKVELVQKAAVLARSIGLQQIPGLSPKAVGMMGLKGVPGVTVEKQQPRPPRGQPRNNDSNGQQSNGNSQGARGQSAGQQRPTSQQQNGQPRQPQQQNGHANGQPRPASQQQNPHKRPNEQAPSQPKRAYGGQPRQANKQ